MMERLTFFLYVFNTIIILTLLLLIILILIRLLILLKFFYFGCLCINLNEDTYFYYVRIVLLLLQTTLLLKFVLFYFPSISAEMGKLLTWILKLRREKEQLIRQVISGNLHSTRPLSLLQVFIKNDCEF